MLGSLLGAGMSAVGSVFGGIAASKAMKKVKGSLESQKRANEAWFNRRYNEDATQRADAQRILSRTEDMIRSRNKQAEGVQAVMGGTEESVAAAKSANSQAMAEAASQIAVNAAARKDQLEGQYQQRDAALDSQLNQMEVNKAKAIGSGVQGVAQAGAGMADAF